MTRHLEPASAASAPSTGPARLAVIAADPAAVDAAAADSVHAGWAAFVESGEEPAGFVLAGWDEAHRDDLAHAIRRSRFWDRHVFCPAGAGEPVSPLLDGAATLQQAHQACERAEGLKRSLQLDPAALHFDERLLYYLYLREPGELQPVLDRRAPQLYRYPIADALAQEGDEVDGWLSTLVRRRLLEPATLVDRTRHCRRCASAHQHFLDVCPHCASLHIRRASSLHCFTCGHVAPEADFRTEGGLTCPKCSTHLRHIGVDYDRPLTQYACGQCHHVFVEANVVARCLDCNAVAEPDALDVREVATLRLSTHGRAALRAGQIQESFAALQGLNHVVPNYFRHLVDWALATQARHAEFGFGFVLVEFLNAAQLIETHGAPRAFLMLDEFARRLHEMLRTSDVTTRTTEVRLWIFLPFSSTVGFEARLRRLFDEQAAGGEPAMQVRIRAAQAPGEVQAGERCEDLMARLAGEEG